MNCNTKFNISVWCSLRRKFEFIVNSPFSVPIFCNCDYDWTCDCANNKAIWRNWIRNRIRYNYKHGWADRIKSSFKKVYSDKQFLFKAEFNYRHHWFYCSMYLFRCILDFQLYLYRNIRVSCEYNLMR